MIVASMLLSSVFLKVRVAAGHEGVKRINRLRLRLRHSYGHAAKGFVIFFGDVVRGWIGRVRGQ